MRRLSDDREINFLLLGRLLLPVQKFQNFRFACSYPGYDVIAGISFRRGEYSASECIYRDTRMVSPGGPRRGIPRIAFCLKIKDSYGERTPSKAYGKDSVKKSVVYSTSKSPTR